MLDAAQRAAVEAEAQQLRLALKTWETAWAREHGGAKPARADISRNPEMGRSRPLPARTAVQGRRAHR